MCLAKKRGPIKTATRDIEVYKILRTGKGKLYPLFFTNNRTRKQNSIILKDYEKREVRVEKPLYRYNHSNFGYYCFRDLSEVKRYIVVMGMCTNAGFERIKPIIYKFVIPKGSKYRKGYECSEGYKSIMLASKLCNGKRVVQ